MESEHRIRLADGRTLACLVLGDLGGRPVFYFHGYPGSRLEGRLATAVARRLGLQVIAPDRPGFGESTFQAERTIRGWAADVAEVADHFALDRFAVVGSSGGNPYALACAARIPQRVSRVALVGGLGPFADERLAQNMMTRNRLILSLARRQPSLVRSAARLAAWCVRAHPTLYLAAMKVGAPPADRAVLADPAYRSLITESTAEALRQGGRGIALELTLLARPWNFGLQEIRLPVQIWQGLADRIVPPVMARHLAQSIPESQPHFLPNEGHLSLIVKHRGTAIAELCRGIGRVA